MTYQPNDERYQLMPFRPTGRSGLVLPALSFGLWQKFGADYPSDKQREILLHAFDLGIVHFDLANRYGPPPRSAEKLFGRILREDLGAYRDELVIATKAGNPIGDSPYLKGASRKSLLGSLEQSLRDLSLDYVDIFYSHSPDLSTPIEETASALASAVSQGKALYVGISNYSHDRARDLAESLQNAGVPLLVHQPRYSIFDRRPENDGLLDLARKTGSGLIVYSPLAQGLLTDKYLSGTIPSDARAASSLFLSPKSIDDVYRQRANALNEIAKCRGQSLAQLSLQWVLRQPEVASAVIGASSTWQLDHNIKALEFPPLTEEELKEIDIHGVHGTGLSR